MRSKRSRYNPSRTSPRGSRRACLCPDGTYSRKCCNGNMINQGIGSISVGGPAQYNSPVSQIHNSFSDDFNNEFAI